MSVARPCRRRREQPSKAAPADAMKDVSIAEGRVHTRFWRAFLLERLAAKAADRFRVRKSREQRLKAVCGL